MMKTEADALTRAQLQEQYDLLRTEYIKLLNDKDVLMQWGKPQLEALYNTRIGYLQIAKPDCVGVPLLSIK